MRNIKKLFILGLCVVSGLFAQAQSQSDMCLNEILSVNTTSFEDDYGNKNGWIELFNSSYGTIDIGGCFLTNDPKQLKKYMIPKGDVLTRIKPRQHILFWADNEPYRGTFHINFKLDDSKEILLVSSDGRTIIDRLTIPALNPNVSFGRLDDGMGDRIGKEGWEILQRATPSTNNKELGLSKGLILQELDPYGIVMTFTAMGVVFLALLTLFLSFKQVGKYAIFLSKRNAEKAAKSVGGDTKVDVSTTSGEVFAAIAVALEAYQRDEEAHDIENTILTIDQVKRNYSPWSSKIYTLRNTPHKK